MISDKKNSKKEHILEAAFACISTKGYANVSLRDIADEAGVVLSQLNYYYTNKEGLFIEIVKTLAKIHLAEMERYLSMSTSSDEKLASLMYYFKETLKNNPEVFKILFDLTSMALWSNKLNFLITELLDDMATIIDDHIKEIVNINPKYSAKSSKEISQLLLSMVLGISLQSMFSIDESEQFELLSTITTLK